jgi:transmembrane sensor
MTDSPPSLPPLAERWDAERTERTLVGLHRKKRTRRRARLGAVVAVLGLLCWQLWPAPVQVVERPRSSPLELALADGSHVQRRDESTQVAVSETSATQVTLELREGQARFDVTRNEQRVFRVRSGEVTVEVLGTSFELERDGARTRVAVSQGRVAVSFHEHHTELRAGEAGWFPREDWLARAAPPSEPSASSTPRARSSSTRSWREPAEQGEFERAYELLAQTRKPVADDVEELMLAADTARLSGHAEAAVPYLRRVMNEHARDSRASLAAFTLGGVLMQQLGQPREAEAAYARARSLSLNSSLAEDALARQVEAAHRAGDSALARSLAREYVAQYPSGRRVRAVRRFGELEP